MAGRPTPPASFLASAQPSVSSRPPRQRPRFARIPSASASTYASAAAAQAVRSDESLASTLETLTLADGDLKASGPGGDVRLQARPAPGTSWDATVCNPLLTFLRRSAGFPNSTELPRGDTGQEEEQTH